MKVRWGIVSTAAINTRILEAARQSRRLEIVAVASRDQARADAYSQRHGIPRGHGSYAALFADPDVEVVYISTPNSSHVALAREALEAGKHVLVEKPVSRRSDEVAALCDLSRERRLVLSEAFMWRHSPLTRTLTELVRDGVVGNVVAVRAAFSHDLVTLLGPDDTRFDPALDGGALMDLGCYCVNAIRLLAGSEPVRVAAEQRVGGKGVDVATVGTIRMRNGVLGSFDCSMVSPRSYELTVVGEHGSIVVSDPWHARRPGIEVRRADRSDRIDVPESDPYRLQLENVSDAIRGRAELLVGPDDMLGQVAAIEGLYRSAESFDDRE